MVKINRWQALDLTVNFCIVKAGMDVTLVSSGDPGVDVATSPGSTYMRFTISIAFVFFTIRPSAGAKQHSSLVL